MNKIQNKSFNIANKAKNDLLEKVLNNLNKNYLWKSGVNLIRPFNPITKTIYKGVNALLLSDYVHNNELSDPRFLTFQNIKNNGYKLEAGSKSSEVFHFNTIKKEISTEEYSLLSNEEKENIEIVYDEKSKITKYFKTKMYVKYFNVFNASKVNGIEKFEIPNSVTNENIERFIKEIINNSFVKVEKAIVKAPHYKPFNDYIVLGINHTDSISRFTALIHELAHATGHQSRLNRNMGSNKLEYAQEELVAAFTEILILSDFGLEYHSTNHQAYINSWVGLLKDKSKALFKAINDAEEAANYIYEHTLKKAMKALNISSVRSILENENVAKL